MEKITFHTKAWLDKRYLGSEPGKTTIIEWFTEFICKRTDTSHAPPSGLPKEMVTTENIKKVYYIVLRDREMKLLEIAEALNMSRKCVSFILNKHLSI